MNFHESPFYMFFQILDNSVLTWGLLACGIAQLSKLVFQLIQHGEWRLDVLLETGGMPSSHSALVTGTASGIGLQVGFNDPVFALAVTIAFVVMYDASGIRQAAGLTASKVNELAEVNLPSSSKKLLKENLGHTKNEVLVGSLLGPLVALPGIFFIGSPLHWIEMIGLIKV